MDRPYIFCHMLTSMDGKIMGNYMEAPESGPAGEVFYGSISYILQFFPNWVLLKLILPSLRNLSCLGLLDSGSSLLLRLMAARMEVME